MSQREGAITLTQPVEAGNAVTTVPPGSWRSDEAKPCRPSLPVADEPKAENWRRSTFSVLVGGTSRSEKSLQKRPRPVSLACTAGLRDSVPGADPNDSTLKSHLRVTRIPGARS